MNLRSISISFFLLFVGAYGAFELRNLATLHNHSGESSSHALGGWIVAVAPLLSLLLGVGLVFLLVATATLSKRSRARGTGLRRLTIVCLLALAHVYACQELLQIALGDGHAVGLHGLFDHGGWVFVPVALLIFTSVATLIRTLRILEDERPLSIFFGLRRPEGPTLGLPAFRPAAPRQFNCVRSFGRGPPLLFG